MDKYEYRRQRLIELKDKFCDGKIQTLADKLERSHSYVSRMLASMDKPHNKKVGDDMLDVIAQAFGVTRAWLDGESTTGNLDQPADISNVGEIGTFHVWQRFRDLPKNEWALLPYYRDTKLSAGNGTDHQIDKNNFKLAFSKATLKKHNINKDSAVCLSVVGDSMMPVLPENTTVAINTEDTKIISGNIYAFKYQNKLHIKILYLLNKDKTIHANSYNPNYSSKEYQISDIEIIGRVFWWSVLV